jgi:predicted dehydrogenase
MPETIGVGVIGLGFMGRTHVAAYRAAEASGLPCRLVALCDRSEARLRGDDSGAGNLKTGGVAPAGGGFAPGGVSAYTDPERLLADPRVGIVSVCTHTDTHVDLTIRALEAGKHVLVEKPVAVTAPEVRRVAEAAARTHERSGALCMPGMVMRFWPGWDWLEARVRDGLLGAVRSAIFARVGAGPSWSPEFYRDISRSGGALVDLHIHDADMVCRLFGRPREVACGGSIDHLTAMYRFEDPKGPRHVAAEGGWSFVPSAGFRMRYTVCFERATADWDLTRTPTLLVHGEKGTDAPALSKESAYELEIRHFVEAAAGRASLRATMDEAVTVAEVLEAERESLRTGRTIKLGATADA